MGNQQIAVRVALWMEHLTRYGVRRVCSSHLGGFENPGLHLVWLTGTCPCHGAYSVYLVPIYYFWPRAHQGRLWIGDLLGFSFPSFLFSFFAPNLCCRSLGALAASHLEYGVRSESLTYTYQERHLGIFTSSLSSLFRSNLSSRSDAPTSHTPPFILVSPVRYSPWAQSFLLPDLAYTSALVFLSQGGTLIQRSPPFKQHCRRQKEENPR
ncbi:hypothetical protein V8C37DRAFT_138141 [Trichoderma ceciliae]